VQCRPWPAWIRRAGKREVTGRARELHAARTYAPHVRGYGDSATIKLRRSHAVGFNGPHVLMLIRKSQSAPSRRIGKWGRASLQEYPASGPWTSPRQPTHPDRVGRLSPSRYDTRTICPSVKPVKLPVRPPTPHIPYDKRDNRRVSASREGGNEHLALQLPFSDVGALGSSLVSSAPE
jgi:hypothetical protein